MSRVQEFDLRLLPEVEAASPPRSDSDEQFLEQSLLKFGMLGPILTWRGIVFDGYACYRLCQKHGIPFEVREVDIDIKDLTTLKIARRHKNMSTRNLGKQELHQARMELVEALVEQGVPALESYQQVADAEGVSARTIMRSAKRQVALSKIDPEVRDQVDVSKLSHDSVLAMARLNRDQQFDLVDRTAGDTAEIAKELSRRTDAQPPRGNKPLVGEPKPEQVKPTPFDKERVVKRPALSCSEAALNALAECNRHFMEMKDAVSKAQYGSCRQLIFQLEELLNEIHDEALSREGHVDA